MTQIAAAVLRAVPLVLLATLIFPPPALAERESGTISWERTVLYWPSESAPQYWMYYPQVNITEVPPGAGTSSHRLTLRNEMEEPLSFNVSVVNPHPKDKAFEALPDAGWITFSEQSGYDSAEVAPATLLEVDARQEDTAGEATLWVHVSIPREKAWLDQRWQCQIRIAPADFEGDPLYSILTVTTSDTLETQSQDTRFILGILFGLFLLSILVIYAFVRWRWPDVK